MNPPILLSICIATFNRERFIGETLTSILNQASNEVEVIVVDGNSTDNTEQVVRGLAERHPQLRYIRLEKKGGLDQDYNKSVELACGEYIWLFTDDDLLKPGAIAVVLEATRKKYSLIIVNAEVRSIDFSLCLQSRRMNIIDDKVYQPTSLERDQLLVATAPYLSFIGAVVLRRAIWISREKAKYFGSMFVHMGLIFQCPMPGRTLVIANPWIIIRYGNAQWVSRGFEIWMFKWPELIWSFPDFSDWAKQKVIAREPWRKWQLLLMDRALGRYSSKEYTYWLKPRINVSPLKLFAWLLAKTPVRLVNLTARWYARYVLRKVPSIGLYDLETSGKKLEPPRIGFN